MSLRLIPPRDFDACVSKLRRFFKFKMGFTEVHTQSTQSILAACEDPQTISTYNYGGKVWPLPQTGQMWLEDVLLSDPDLKGAFTVSTSYRNEPDPVPGRHELTFPMFEFEMKGDMADLENLMISLCKDLGFSQTDGTFPGGDYNDVANMYGVKELEHEHEARLEDDYGPVYLLKNFPIYTSPFWNMKWNEDTQTSNKIDVIIHGVETIGSAERSTNKDEMREMFNTISDGEYKGILYNKFGRERVDRELDKFLDYDFFPRFGGGIGVTRMISAMKQSNILYDTEA